MEIEKKKKKETKKVTIQKELCIHIYIYKFVIMRVR